MSGGKPPASGAAQAERRVFVLDTNVLMHDPAAIFRFEEHDIYIPMIVVEELDAGKKGLSEAARNVRQVSRFLDELMANSTKEQIDHGLELPSGRSGNHGKQVPTGRLFFQTRRLGGDLPDTLPGHGADNSILAYTLALQRELPDCRGSRWSRRTSTCASRPRCSACTPRTTSATAPSRTRTCCTPGSAHCPPTSGNRTAATCTPGRSLHARSTASAARWCANGMPNQFVYDSTDEGFEALVRRVDGDTATLEVAHDYRSERHAVWGIRARNREQNFALNLLLDPEVDFVTVLGPAGTGKTLLALAAGLALTLEQNRFTEILMTRVTIPLGEDIGFLPGTEEEKMEPWMGALMDNLEVLTQGSGRRQLGPCRHQ